jgi:hypothetical protein
VHPRRDLRQQEQREQHAGDEADEQAHHTCANNSIGNFRRWTNAAVVDRLDQMRRYAPRAPPGERTMIGAYPDVENAPRFAREWIGGGGDIIIVDAAIADY